MNKQEYFKLSLEQNLPGRCPILGYCDRHSLTLYFFSQYDEIDYDKDFIKTLQKEDVLSSDYESKRVKLRAEEPLILRGPKFGHFSNMCPEVNLFDKDNSIGEFRGVACTDGAWDFERNPNNKVKILETKHFSECLEFSKHQYLANNIKSKEDFLNEEFEEISIFKLNLDRIISDILNNRIIEIKLNITSKAPLSAIVMIGSTLEGILLGFASKNPKDFNQAIAAPKDKDGKTKLFQDWTLSNFIDVAFELRLINEDVKKFSHSLRDFRNYIHPFEQMSNRFEPDSNTAKLSWNVLKVAMIQLSKKNK